MQLQDKVAVVTGATGGIGFGIAQAFVAHGATVVVTGRSVENGAKAIAELGGESRAVFVAGDAQDQSHIEASIDRAVERFGRLDILVNNSGGLDDFNAIAEMSNDSWDHALRWNLTAPFWGCRHALTYMIPQGSGRIINMSSVEGKQGKPGMVQYVTAKHGLLGLTKGLAQEVGPLGITVNAICPGLVLTPAILAKSEQPAKLQGLSTEAFLETYAQESAIKRFNTVEEIAAMAVLVASDAGGGITGASLSVDGGTAAY